MGLHRRRAQRHRDEGGHGAGMRLMRWNTERLCSGHWLNHRIVAECSDVARNSVRRIAGALVLTQTVLLEPAMQHIGIHAMFTRCCGNGCAGLLARGDQLSLEMRAVDPASAWGTGARIGNLLSHGVHDGLRGHDGACNCSFGVDGVAGRIRRSFALCKSSSMTPALMKA